MASSDMDIFLASNVAIESEEEEETASSSVAALWNDINKAFYRREKTWKNCPTIYVGVGRKTLGQPRRPSLWLKSRIAWAKV